MTAAALLERLHGVRQTARGWIGLCPAHPDKSPSLSIRETDDGKILLKCFAGCDVASICEAVEIELQDLFAQQGRVSAARPKKIKKTCPVGADENQIVRDHFLNGVMAVLAAPYPIHVPDEVDRAREAESLIHSARDLDISRWSDEQLDAALNRLAEAYHTLEYERIAHG